MNFTITAGFLWSVADLLRGDYKQSDYGKVILPFTLLRRLDCVLEATKAAVLEEYEKRKDLACRSRRSSPRKARQSFYNTSPLDFRKLLADPGNIKANLTSYLNAFSPNARDIFERYEFFEQIERLDGANLLYQVVQKFAAVDLHPQRGGQRPHGAALRGVDPAVRRTLQRDGRGALHPARGDPADGESAVHRRRRGADPSRAWCGRLYDPAAGTGGMLSIAEEHLRATQSQTPGWWCYGQELNAESYAICKADMLIKGQDIGNIIFGNTLSSDGHAGKTFDYMLSNPPFGVEWKKVEKEVREEHEQRGHAGRFGPGLPRVSDGSLLFLLHLLSKMRPTRRKAAAGSASC